MAAIGWSLDVAGELSPSPRKMALQKLRKLRDTIRSLPATALRQQLVEAVKEHPVVLVAGAGW